MFMGGRRRREAPRGPLADRTYRRLFAAQVISLAGTGVTTVALGLLAYDLAGSHAGAVLGGVLALKMVAYVGLAPVIAAFAGRFPRRRMLVTLDLVQGAVVLGMLFVSEVWHVYVLIFVLHAAAAGFTPAFQAAMPEVLPEERRYTRALSLSRLAYDLGELLSPALAAALLLLLDFHALFALDGATFLVGAALIMSSGLNASARGVTGDRTLARITSGVRRYLATPRLRGLLALNVAVASASAMTIVNTVVLVRDDFGGGDSAVAVALGAAGAGSMVTALALPRILDRLPDRPVMLAGGALLPVGLVATALVPSYGVLLGTWFAIGVGLSLVQTPAGRLIQRSADEQERPALFAAQFSLSHACWLATYPIAGVLGAAVGIETVAWLLAGVAAVATLAATRLWPARPRTLAGDRDNREAITAR